MQPTKICLEAVWGVKMASQYRPPKHFFGFRIRNTILQKNTILLCSFSVCFKMVHLGIQNLTKISNTLIPFLESGFERFSDSKSGFGASKMEAKFVQNSIPRHFMSSFKICTNQEVSQPIERVGSEASPGGAYLVLRIE